MKVYDKVYELRISDSNTYRNIDMTQFDLTSKQYVLFGMKNCSYMTTYQSGLSLQCQRYSPIHFCLALEIPDACHMPTNYTYVIIRTLYDINSTRSIINEALCRKDVNC